MKKIFVAIPTFDKKLFVPCVQSIMNAMQAMLLMDIKFEFKFEVGCPYVSMARNNLVRKFMNSECTDLVFVDADLGFPPLAFKDLILSDEPVVGGAYPKKQENEEYAVRLKTDENYHVINENGALLSDGLATGFMKVNRSVFEQLQKAYPELKYRDAMTGLDTYNFFGTFVKDGRWYGDDYGFCHFWENLGGKMHLIPNITFIHCGSKNFEGNFHDYLVKLSQNPVGVQKALVVDGFMTPQELKWLYDKAGEVESVIELGSWKGRSTIALLNGCNGTVTAVDNWLGHDPSSNGILQQQAENENIFETFKENTKGYQNLKIIRGDTKNADCKPADMVFIDAEHTYEGCKADISKWLPKAKKIICGHDYNNEWPGVVQAVNEAFGEVNVVGTIWYKEFK